MSKNIKGQIYKLFLKRARCPTNPIFKKYPLIRSSHALAEMARELTADEPVEVSLAFFFAGDTFLGYCEVARGGFSSVCWDPKVIFSSAMLCGASMVTVTHNHPSGDAKASRQDVQGMKKLIPAGALLGIQVWDHVVVAPDSHCSMREFGLLPPSRELIKDAEKRREQEYDEIDEEALAEAVS